MAKAKPKKFGIGGFLKKISPGVFDKHSVINPENAPLVGKVFKNNLAEKYDFILNPAHDMEQWLGLRDEYGEGTGYNAKDPSMKPYRYAKGGTVRGSGCAKRGKKFKMR